MNLFRLKQIKAIILTVSIISAVYCQGKSFKDDFESPETFKSWKGWSLAPQKIKRVKNDTGGHALQFTGAGWNTPIIDIKPPFVVTATTVLRFKIKTSRKGSWEVNLSNGSEGSSYSMLFNVLKANKWTSIELTVKDADYKNYGKAGVQPDGMLGDELAGVQIAFLGKKVLIDDFEIVNLLESDIKKTTFTPKYISEYLYSYQKQNYSQLSRNGVFPFGAVMTVYAEHRNAKFFGQMNLERYEAALLEMKQRGFNTISNFCDGTSTERNLELMQKYHLYLLNTATCGRTVYALPDKHDLSKTIKKFSYHPNLLAWYGQDEPTKMDVYLKNKKRVETLSSGGAPYSSAMHMSPIIKAIGPCMEVVIIDRYSLSGKFDPVASSTTLAKHSIHIKNAKKYSKSKRVWFIAQAFSLRQGGKRILRFPKPVEVRFEVFNALAAGASGFVFFIYNDSVPYLDKKPRGEEFDQTLTDAWGNANATSNELSKLACRLVPIMPSFLDITESKKIKITCTAPKIVLRQWENELGTLVFCVNSDLSQKRFAKINFVLPAKHKIYNLDTLRVFRKNSIKINLKPGDGKLLLIANSKQFAKAAIEIKSRKSIARWEMMTVKLAVLKQAGFDTSKISQELKKIEPNKKGMAKIIPVKILDELEGNISDLRNSNSTYCDVADSLERVKKIFGKINATLVVSGVIEKVDNNPKWYNIFDLIKKSGKEYFSLRRDWSNGKFDIPQRKLPELENALVELEKQITTKLHENKIKPLW